MNTLSEALADFICGVKESDLPRADVEAAKAAIGDCIGCAIVGSATPAGSIARDIADVTYAHGSSTSFGGRHRLSAQGAAFVNGVASHALDYDDILWTQYGHPSVSVLSAALAVAEQVQASGRELILAYAIGLEIDGKLGRSANPRHYEHGWHATGSIGVFGATAASCRLMKLTPAQTAMALGIAASESSGVRRNMGTMTKPFHAGDAARGGVLAAELAAAGFTSSTMALEGEAGWGHVLQARSMPDPAQVSLQLARPWELSVPGIVLKRYPSCGCTHCALDALISILHEEDINSDDIERIDCDASPLAAEVLKYHQPTTGLEGKFSMEFCMAVAAVTGQAGLQQFRDDVIHDPRVLAMMKRVRFQGRSDLEPPVSADAVPSEVTVHARGMRFSKRVLVPAGDPRAPLTSAQRLEKFMSCARSIVTMPVALEIFNHIERLDTLGNVADMLTAIVPMGLRRAV